MPDGARGAPRPRSGRQCGGRVCPDAVRGVVAHGVQMLRSGRGCGGRCGVSAHGVGVAQIASEVRPAYQGGKYNIYIMC